MPTPSWEVRAGRRDWISAAHESSLSSDLEKWGGVNRAPWPGPGGSDSALCPDRLGERKVHRSFCRGLPEKWHRREFG